MADGGVVTARLVLNTAGFTSAWKNVMNQVQNANFNRFNNSMRNLEQYVRKSSNNVANNLGNITKYVPKAVQDMYNLNYQAQAGVRNLERFSLQSSNNLSLVSAASNKMANGYQSAIQRMQNSSSAGTRVIGNSLNTVNRVVNFDGMVSRFKGAMTAMQNAASAGAQGIKDKLQSGIGATDYMAAIFGSAIGGQLFEKAQGKATMTQMLSNKYGKGGQSYMAGYQKYTIASSTQDQQITNLMKYITQSGIKPGQTYGALSSIDAAATSADPIQRHELLRNFGQYLTNGYSEALFRGDVTKDEAAKLKAAETPDERIAAMNELAKGRGNVDKFGANLSTATTGPVAAFNAALVTMDTLVRGMTQGFTNLMVTLKPVFDLFNSLNPATQNLIGQFAFFAAGTVILISTLGIFYQIIAPLGSAFFGLINVIGGAATGMNAAAIANGAFTTSLRVSAIAILTHPIFIMAAVFLAVGAAVYLVGNQLGWFKTNLEKAGDEEKRLTKQTNDWKTAQGEAKKRVEELTEKLKTFKKGSPEWIQAKKDLAKAETDYATATEGVNKAQGIQNGYTKDLATAQDELARSYVKLSQALIAYAVASKSITPEEGKKRLGEVKDITSANMTEIDGMKTEKKRVDEQVGTIGTQTGVANAGGVPNQGQVDYAGTLSWFNSNQPAWQLALKGFTDPVGLLGSSLQKLGVPMETARGVFQMMGDALNTPMDKLRDLGGALTTFKALLAMIIPSLPSLKQWASETTGPLQSIICMLLGCSPGIVPALKTMRQVFFDTLASISGFVGNPLNTVRAVFFSVFGGIYNYVRDKLNGIKSGFINMKSSLISSAQNIQSGVWGPISKLWNNLKGFWSWLKGSGTGTTTGSSASASAAGGTKRSALGYSSGVSGSNGYAGFFGNVANAAFSRTSSSLGYAGGSPADAKSAEAIMMNPQMQGCTDDSCYAGSWDYSKRWIDSALNSVNAWKMNVNGTQVGINSLSNGSMGTFNALANALISGTHYEFYYGDKKSNAQALKDKGFNCYDGAQIMIALAQSMGLPAYMASGKWGKSNIGHVWAVVNGVPYDTTARQQIGTWSPPPGSFGSSVGQAASARMAGGGIGGYSKVEINVDLSGSVIYGDHDLDKHIEHGVNKGITKFMNPDGCNGS